MYYTDDPVRDAERYYEEQEKALEKLPRCSQCDSYIQQDYAVYINGEYICDDCIDYLRVGVVTE